MCQDIGGIEMSKMIVRYSITMLKYPKGHGYRHHLSGSKKNAKALAQRIGGKYRIRKIKPKYI